MCLGKNMTLVLFHYNATLFCLFCHFCCCSSLLTPRQLLLLFSSNTFNICVGLGLPWLMYIMGMGFEPYHDLENEGIVESIMILAVVLLIFVALMISTNFVLLKWHADLFIGLYVAYVVFAVGQVYIDRA